MCNLMNTHTHTEVRRKAKECPRAVREGVGKVYHQCRILSEVFVTVTIIADPPYREDPYE